MNLLGGAMKGVKSFYLSRYRLTAGSAFTTLTAACLFFIVSACSDFYAVNTNSNSNSNNSGANYHSTAIALDPQQKNQLTESLAAPQYNDWPAIASRIPVDQKLEARIAALLGKMSLEAKVAQMIQAEIKSISPEQVKEYRIGSILNGGGSFPNNDKYATIHQWLALADQYYFASMALPTNSTDLLATQSDKKEAVSPSTSIPIIWGTDAVHGHNNVLGATIFPHNIGLGATANAALMREIAKVTANEVAVTGIDWIFAPTVAIAEDRRWGRSYESYSQQPALVRAYASEAVLGMQGNNAKQLRSDKTVIATVKHFLGDGGTDEGKDQGNARLTELELINVHAQGYYAAIEAGAQTIMASFNSWNGDKVHGSQYLLTDVLKDKIGFDGFVIGDWNGHGQVANCSNSSCPAAINAGIDMLMVPDDWQKMLANTVAQVNDGTISETRINDAVTRILRVKMRAGLFDNGPPSSRTLAGNMKYFASEKNRAVARQAARESLVLLKNKNSLLPLNAGINVLVAGDGADNIEKQTGGWTLSWQGTDNSNTDFPNATSIFSGIQQAVSKAGGTARLSPDGFFSHQPDVAIIVFGEQPYAEGAGDRNNLVFDDTAATLALLQKLRGQGIPVVSVFISGRPLWVNEELNASDAFVAAWLPGSEGGAIADLLFKQADNSVVYDFTGQLPFDWPGVPYHHQLIAKHSAGTFASDKLTTRDANGSTNPHLFETGFGLNYSSLDTLSSMLPIKNTKPKLASRADEPYPIFVNQTIDPWKFYLGNAENWSVMISGNIGTTADGDAIIVNSVDKELQQDARRITWNSQNEGQVFFQHDSSIDLSSYLEAGSTLVFDIRVDSAPTSDVNVRIDCQYPCTGAVDLTSHLSTMPIGDWHSVMIDLTCFANAGTRFSHVNTPFLIQSSGQLELSVSNIHYMPESRDSANIKCTDLLTAR